MPPGSGGCSNARPELSHPFDFSGILPGRYKLIAELDDDIRVERTIEVKSNAAAPVIEIDALTPPRFTPSGELRLTGTITDADAQHEIEVLKPEQYHDRRRIWTQFPVREGSVLIAVDGAFAGYADAPGLEMEGLPSKRTWEVKIPLVAGRMRRETTFRWGPGPHRVTVITTDMHGNGGVTTKLMAPAGRKYSGISSIPSRPSVGALQPRVPTGYITRPQKNGMVRTEPPGKNFQTRSSIPLLNDRQGHLSAG